MSSRAGSVQRSEERHLHRQAAMGAEWRKQQQAWAGMQGAGALRFYGCFLVFLAPWGRFSTRNVL